MSASGLLLRSRLPEYLLSTRSESKWKITGTHRRAGVLLPLFSVYSKNSLGIGDLHDLELVIDWAVLSGNSIIQLLPMNDLGSIFCPYDSTSSFALEPMYISIFKLASAKNKAIEAQIKKIKSLFPTGEKHVDYKIKKEKMRLLRLIYDLEGIGDMELFNKFKEENSYWILDFALFKVLKEKHEQRPWYEWEDRYRGHNKQELENFYRENKNEIDFQIWAQWQLFRQFKEIKAYAKEKKLLIKGDLPILVSRDSADVWAHPEFFKLDFAAGAPPDMYCAKGQRWGMPTYNWERITSDSYIYLKEKLNYAQNFYDILRIDHVVGLFRIWSIPYHEPLENQGLNGFFDPHEERIWGEHGRNILSVMLNNTHMLLCAEDLGVIPKVCTDTLREFGIPGNDVQRWVKDWKTRHDFLKPQEYRALSVAMLSTHDTTNWPAWWENEAGTIDEALFIRKCNDRHIDSAHIKHKLFDSARSNHARLRWKEEIASVDMLVSILGKRKEEVGDFIDLYENSYLEKEKLWAHLKIKGRMREKSDTEIVRKVLEISLESSSIFCINTVIDWLYLADSFKGDPYQYRTNNPGSIGQDNWSLTIPFSMEELLKLKINKVINSMVAASGRV
jgi:4-alpha-glucanotransferase